MKYMRVDWIHNDPRDPVELYSELDDDRWEVRKVEIFLDGSVGWADQQHACGTSFLGTVPTPKLAEIAEDPQFKAREISKEEFETCWQMARMAKLRVKAPA